MAADLITDISSRIPEVGVNGRKKPTIGLKSVQAVSKCMCCLELRPGARRLLFLAIRLAREAFDELLDRVFKEDFPIVGADLIFSWKDEADSPVLRRAASELRSELGAFA